MDACFVSKEARVWAILREYNELWMEDNCDFIKKCEKEDEREISRDYALYPYKANLRAYSGGKVGDKGGFGISPPGAGGS